MKQRMHIPVSMLVPMVKPSYLSLCCMQTVVGDTTVPSTSAENRISTMVRTPSMDIHGNLPLPVHTIAISLAFTPPMGYGSISSKSCIIDLILVTFWLAPVSLCTDSVRTVNAMSSGGSACGWAKRTLELSCATGLCSVIGCGSVLLTCGVMCSMCIHCVYTRRYGPCLMSALGPVSCGVVLPCRIVEDVLCVRLCFGSQDVHGVYDWWSECAF